MSTSVYTYPIDLFHSLDIGSYTLPHETVQHILQLTTQVSAPTYQTTPVFPKKNYQKRKPKQNQQISNEDWGAIRNFKTTEINNTPNYISECLNKVRLSLNKLAKKTYNTEKEEMFNTIGLLIDHEESNNDTMITVGQSIFDIASSNTFYSAIYSNLYKDLTEKHTIFSTILEQNLNKMKIIYNVIEWADSNGDYTVYCDVNDKNDKRLALSLFFSNLAKIELIPMESINEIILCLQNKIDEQKDCDCKENVIYEITKNLHIILTNIHESLRNYENGEVFESVFEKITEISNMSNSQHKSISNKIIFENLDMVEEFS
jgi:hypothetical protein